MRMNKTNLIHSRTCVYNVNYHIVWSVKYRRKVLTNEVETYLKSVLMDIAREKGFAIAACEVVENDHVHVFVSAHPKIAPSYIAKMLKGISGRKLFLQYPELTAKLWKGHLWNPSYYLETIGSVSEEAVKTYIERQSKGGEGE